MCTTAKTQCAPDGEVGTEPRHLAGNFANLQGQLIGGGQTKYLTMQRQSKAFPRECIYADDEKLFLPGGV